MVCLEDAHKMSLTAQKWETYRFTSKEFDRETGLYYFGARYYEPKLSNWMSVDPSGFELINPMDSEGKPRKGYSIVEALNWYAYVGNNPVIFVDPTGEEISVHAHQVLRSKKHHWSIRITLDTQELKDAFAGDERFEYTDKDGNPYLTIGAGPNWKLKLESKLNRRNDVNLDNKEANISLDIDADKEVGLIQKLLDAEDAYDDKTRYTILLKEGKDAGYNSNSFFAGILRFIGIIPPPTELDSPGLYSPLPPEEFRNEQQPQQKDPSDDD